MGAEVWTDTRLPLTGLDPALRWRNLFTGELLTPEVRDGQPSLAAADLFAHFPVALLLAERRTDPLAAKPASESPGPPLPRTATRARKRRHARYYFEKMAKVLSASHPGGYGEKNQKIRIGAFKVLQTWTILLDRGDGGNIRGLGITQAVMHAPKHF